MPFVPDLSDRLVQVGFPAALAEELQTAIQGPVSGAGNSDFIVDYVVSGLLPPAAGAIGAAALPAGVAYVTGKRVSFDGAVLALTDGSDNYVDLDRDGNVIVSVVAKNAGAPAKAANSIRLGKVVTTAGSVTSRVIDAADSNGNWMSNYVSMPYCRVLNASLVNYSSARDGALSFGAATTKYDNVGMHSESVNTDRLTVTRSGLYHFSGFVNFPSNASAQAPIVKAFVNGSSAGLGNRTLTTPSAQTISIDALVNLRAGDYMQLWLNNPGTALDVSSCGFALAQVG